MRDVILALFIVGMLPMILRRPALGALMWVWISIMNPHSLTYGFARSVPWAQMIAITTLLGLLFSGKRHPLPRSGGTWIIVLFLLWMSVTSLTALNPRPEEVLDRWVTAVKILFMLLVTLMLLRGRKEIEWLLWALVISVGYYGVKGGMWTLATGGGGRVWGPPGGTISGNNELAVALVMILPWMYYLREVAGRPWVRRALLISMIFVAFGILGSQSRGALLALITMAMVLGIKGKRIVRTTLALIVVGSIAIAFMPDSWNKRMDTIATYKQDGSAMSRIWTWTTLFNVAVDRPLVGAGFRADNTAVFAKYAPRDGYEMFIGSVFVAHSIYFQALGEQGFVGLAIYLGLGVWTWLAAARLANEAKDDPEYSSWVPLLMRMTQVSLVGFACGGAFLSLMLLDLSYYIPCIVILVDATLRQRQTVKDRTAATARRSSLSLHGSHNHALTGHPTA